MHIFKNKRRQRSTKVYSPNWKRNPKDHLGGDQWGWIFVERQINKVLANRKVGKKNYVKVVWSNVSQLLGFVCIYSSHLCHLDATSIVDGLWWRGQILSLKIRVWWLISALDFSHYNHIYNKELGKYLCY